MNMTDSKLWILPLLGIGSLALLFFGLQSNKTENQVEDRLQQLSRSSAKKATTREKQLESSFEHRVLFPLAQMIFERTQAIIPLSSKSWVKTKLIQAGFQKPHYLKVFLGIQLLTSTVLFGMIFSFTALFGKVSGVLGIIIAGFFGLAGYGFPMIWLIQQAQKRQQSIQKSLADFLDLLVICVEAGLSLDVAIGKITSMKSVRTSQYLREELLRYIKDVGLGLPRKDALLEMADRTGVDDFNTIINAIVQSYDMGASVGHTLRVQSDSLRVKRLAQAEEKANKIPVKMVIPIYVFLFPAIFVCIFGPIGMIMIEAVMKIMKNVSLGA
ncbi:MAG: type II secretion system F family protein [Cyanobacteria bacterium P01_H01_bin.74]